MHTAPCAHPADTTRDGLQSTWSRRQLQRNTPTDLVGPASVAGPHSQYSAATAVCHAAPEDRTTWTTRYARRTDMAIPYVRLSEPHPPGTAKERIPADQKRHCAGKDAPGSGAAHMRYQPPDPHLAGLAITSPAGMLTTLLALIRRPVRPPAIAPSIYRHAGSSVSHCVCHTDGSQPQSGRTCLRQPRIRAWYAGGRRQSTLARMWSEHVPQRRTPTLLDRINNGQIPALRWPYQRRSGTT